MSVDIEPVEIVICLGSSCFARGNAENLAILDEFVQKRGLKARVRLSGKLCQDECKRGPNLAIDGAAQHEVTPTSLRQLLTQLGKRATEA